MADKKVDGKEHELNQLTSDSGLATEPDLQAPNAKRRGLIKAGIVAAPLVLTLKGRAAMGHTKDGPSKMSKGNSNIGANQLNQDTELKRG